MAVSKPISWLSKTNTTFISLNNNFETLLTLDLGCFLLNIQLLHIMFDYSILILVFMRTNIH